jgi:hypothetical protein
LALAEVAMFDGDERRTKLGCPSCELKPFLHFIQYKSRLNIERGHSPYRACRKTHRLV